MGMGVNHTEKNSLPKWSRFTWMFYIVIFVLMMVLWTIENYFDQPYPSPVFRDSLLDCLRYASWTVAVESAGPMILISPLFISRFGTDSYVWQGPIYGAVVFSFLILIASRFGRKWSPYMHLTICTAWILFGTLMVTLAMLK
ncbi:MAG: hypothetical protein GC164_04755 [Phycisphaera sp.]|nr:hypothetical protein [Phycisphaera sp.]